MSNSNYENAQGQRNFRGAQGDSRNNSRGRYSGNRDGGGFRIRLSDNEMKAVKTIQEAFNLKSTVAVLGFSVRTLSELLNDDSLKDSIKKYAQNNKNNFAKDEANLSSGNDKTSTPNPFARPEKKPKPEEVKNSIENIDEK